MSLEEFAAERPHRKQGFMGVMDLIDPEHKAEAIAGYAKGYSGPTIRAWLQEEYKDRPEIVAKLTASSVDLWLSKHHPRFTRG